MMPRHVLLLGGCGFAGSALTAALLQCGCRVSVIGRTPRQHENRPGIDYYPASLEHQATLKALLPCVDVVIHLASASTPSTSSLDPSFETLHNVMPMARFLDVFAEWSDIPLIYLSSGGAIYGDPPTGRATEDLPLRPLSYYGAGKSAIEALIQSFCHQAKRDAFILRPSNFYGPSQGPRPGFGLIPTLFHRALGGGAIDIWGDGNTVRDYLYIDDFVRLVIRLLEMRPQGCVIYNVGSGTGMSINAMCEAVEGVTGKTLLRNYHPIRKVDVKHIVLDIDKVVRETGWAPEVAIGDGLLQTWNRLMIESGAAM